VTIRWHPFELNPHMPEEGQNLREHLSQKYGSTIEQASSKQDPGKRHRLERRAMMTFYTSIS